MLLPSTIESPSATGMTHKVLALIALPEMALQALRAAYDLRYEPNRALQAALFEQSELSHFRAVLTNGSRGLSALEMDKMPHLEIVSTYGVGYENVDIEHARERGIRVSHCPGANDDTVADHALGMMLCLARGFHRADPRVRLGHWEDAREERPTLNLSRLGLLGLGRIGSKIALRAQAFGMAIHYHTPVPKTVPWSYCSCVLDLAQSSDFLVLACPGGKATWHAVNAQVLQALGPQGYLVNIARGSVVQTDALVQALKGGVIAGAALDVFENEPHIDADLLACDNALFTPHMSGRSPAAYRVQTDILMNNWQLQFSAQMPLYVL